MIGRAAPVPLTRELVLIGGGHAHALVLRRWGMRPVPGARLTLIDPGATAPYTGMLPGHIAGHYPRAALEVDLVRLARHAGARLVLGRVEALDPVARRVHVPGRAPMAYDLASVDIGITSDMAALPGFRAHGVPAKPLARFADRWAAFCNGAGAADVVIIGGGIAGVELAMACAHRLSTLGRAARVSVVDRGTLLDKTPTSARTRLIAAMDRYGIARLERAEVAEVTADGVRLSDGRELPSDMTIGAAGAVPYGWLEQTGLALRNGYIAVDEQLRSISHPAVYAAGDCAHLTHAPRPKAGVFAVRQAPVLARNLRADLTGAARRAYRPQRDFLKLVSLGDRVALAEKAGITLAGPAMWRWKDRIDRSFMDQFTRLKPMSPGPAPSDAAKGVARAMAGPAICGGCGAKLGAEALTAALTGLETPDREDVTQLPGDDAAVLSVGDGKLVLSTDHLRAFCDDPVLMARVAAIHAMGDVWAMGATPQAATATVILPHMRPAMQGVWLGEIMAEAARVFGAEGAAIVGGHSSEGAELTLGFTVTGVLDRPAVTLAGGRPGDVLILTKPIGTGTILAAEMRLKARGDDVAAAWDMMGTPSGAVAHVLAPVARAMTDVTGFGLAGHVMNICRASGTGAVLEMDAVPILRGADALAAEGVRSTLYPANAAALGPDIVAPHGPCGALLFDPQTAGGLLAAVPPDQAAQVLGRLPPGAVRIGALTDGPARITVR